MADKEKGPSGSRTATTGKEHRDDSASEVAAMVDDEIDGLYSSLLQGGDGATRKSATATPAGTRDRRGSIYDAPIGLDERKRGDHLRNLVVKKHLESEMMRSVADLSATIHEIDEEERLLQEDEELVQMLRKEAQGEMKNLSKNILAVRALLQEYGIAFEGLKEQSLEVRVKDFTFSVPVNEASGKIETVYTASFLYPIYKLFKVFVLRRGEWKSKTDSRKNVLDRIDLLLEPGKSYLVLGPPQSGKSTLLKAIAGLLRPSRNDIVDGKIEYNGRSLADKKEFHIENEFAYIDQLDKHAPRLTVQETFAFAHRCKASDPDVFENPSGEQAAALKRAAKDLVLVKMLMLALGLNEVKDTFVGDTVVRGVSGGQRRRVTVGEMLAARAAIVCGDEISTGLDASSTYDMVKILVHLSKLTKVTRIFSLLQPSPETVSLFDEVIVLAEGKLLYAGPVELVDDHFAGIGFSCPPYVDLADFLQMLSTGDAAQYYAPTEPSQRETSEAPSTAELAEIFRASTLGESIRARLEAPYKYVWSAYDKLSMAEDSEVSPVSMSDKVKRKYARNFFQTTYLLLARFLTLWTRDKRVIFAGAAKNIIMGVSVGGVYLNTTDPISIQGALFQAGLFIVLGAMQSASALLEDRIIFYKHFDANFYSAWPFVFGRAVSQIPQTLSDTILFATILYFQIGLAGRQSAGNFFTYLALLVVFAILMIQQLAMFAAFATSGTLSAISACMVLLLVLFGGFIVSPVAIPIYYTWLYWWNPFAWVYRALVVLEFYSGRWPDPEQILVNSGMVDAAGEAFGPEWVGYAFAYCLPYALLGAVLTALSLRYLRNEVGGTSSQPQGSNIQPESAEKPIKIPFKPVNLSFHDISYDVTASTSSDTLRLLDRVNGVFRANRMCALMGTSGAGKTTLMDVIALRKRSGTITGKILINGWPQERVSFRRCSGYVEQFDVQSPELTIRETILCSARLRLDPEVISDAAEVEAFVDQVIAEVELSILQHQLVGTDEEGGLSFEQKKRLSIAVELAASPSIIFLDEPTSGLDARSAMLVVRALRKIADGGRTIIATIHQPSSAVFSMFDDLLLLKKGGKVVYAGPLGDTNCSELVDYFESKGAPHIELGDNPANWMLRALDAPNVGDLAEVYVESAERSIMIKELEEIEETREESGKILYDSEFAAKPWQRRMEINRRLSTIYWRSPTYNYSRLIVSVLIAFVLGSVFVNNRRPATFSESDMTARVSVVFLSFIITGIMAILSVLPVMTKIRDMFYRHRDAGMYDSASMGLALGVAEKWFIILSTTLFCVVFLATSGLVANSESYVRIVGRCIAFWGFFTFNFAIYSYFGQLFVCLVKPLATAIILSSVWIGLNNFFAGLVVRPQFMVGTFYLLPYYICAGHYVYNGMITSLYWKNNAVVVPSPGSSFDQYLYENDICTDGTTSCTGTAFDFVQWFFGGQYAASRRDYVVSGVVLGVFLILPRLCTWFALKYIRFSS